MDNAKRLFISCVLTLLVAQCVRAHQEESAAPAQEEAPAAPAEAPNPSATLRPDTRPLSGGEEWRVESPSRARNFAIPSLRISAFGDSNRTVQSSGTQGVELTTSIIGNLAVHRVTRRNDFALDYTGGGLIYTRNSQLNAMMHQLGITQTYSGRRWGITLGDQVSYLPESSFGFGGFGPSMGLGGNFGSLNPIFSANQTLFSGRGSRIANSALAQVEYKASSRSAITFSGSYGILRFREPGFIESNSALGVMGYNYAATRKDTVSVMYGFGAMRFLGSDFKMDNHFALISYGRRVTGRLAFALSAGPQISIIRNPLIGSTTNVNWNAHTSLDYSLERTGLNWSYAHYTSSGSGLFFGAKTDTFHGSLSRQLTRNWGWSMGPGYSRNARLAQGPSVTPASAFNSLYATTAFNRKLGRYTDFSFSYSLHEQWSSAANASSINNGSTYLRHFFGMTVTWHTPRIAMN